MYYLGIDWGLNRTGLAIADDELQIATALGEVETVGLIERIKELQLEYNFREFIFGGLKFGDIFNSADENIKNQLKSDQQVGKEKCLKDLKKLGIEITIAEEMFSTKMAQQNLLEGEKKKVSKQDNGEAAKIILQGWLDK